MTQAQLALNWKYRGGVLLDYYKKQQLINLAFPGLNAHNFFTLVLLGLPDEPQKPIPISEITSKNKLRQLLSTLKPLKAVMVTVIGKGPKHVGKVKRNAKRM